MAFEALFKGYPYDGIKSRETFKHRPEFKFDGKERVVLTFIPGEFKVPAVMTEQELKDFLFFRCFDFQQALRTAETQIADIYIQKEYPFIPEDFGFKKVVVEGASESATVNLYNNGCFTIVRSTDPQGPSDGWLVGIDREIIKRVVRIPNMLVAHALFTALGVIKEDEEGETYAGPSMTAEEVEEANKAKEA